MHVSVVGQLLFGCRVWLFTSLDRLQSSLCSQRTDLVSDKFGSCEVQFTAFGYRCPFSEGIFLFAYLNNFVNNALQLSLVSCVGQFVSWWIHFHYHHPSTRYSFSHEQLQNEKNEIKTIIFILSLEHQHRRIMIVTAVFLQIASLTLCQSIVSARKLYNDFDETSFEQGQLIFTHIVSITAACIVVILV